MMKKTKLHQPKVFYLSFIMAMFERFGFYIPTFVLVIYMKNSFNLSDTMAFTVFGVFNALVFITPAIGGYLADNVFGIRRSIVLGLLLEGAGLMLLSSAHQLIFILGMALIPIGEGLFKTGPTNLLARSYEKDDPRIDSGFTLFYMAMNVGSFFSPIVAGFIQLYFGWHLAFLVAGIALYVALILYYILKGSAKKLDAKAGYQKISNKTFWLTILGIVVALVFFSVFIYYVLVAYIFFFAVAIGMVIYFSYEIIRSKKEDKLKIIACLSLILMGLVFFILYFQYYTSINLFINRSMDQHLFGIKVPSLVFLSLNGFWIVVLSPMVASVYTWLGKHGKDPAVTTKFPLGILITSFCFLSLALGTHFANSAHQVSSWWLILAIALYSLGELLTSALGVAMVTHIAPKRMYGVMMGTWFLVAMGLSSSVASLFAGLANVPKTLLSNPAAVLQIYNTAFIKIGVGGIIAALVAFIVSPYIKRIANL